MKRNISIDILKCLATLLITNSHMGLLYGKYSFLATGGAIGDVLFFFCSGFTLFLHASKQMEGSIKFFPNWYKQRINRIYPTLFAVAVMGCLFFDIHWDIVDIGLARRYWFVSCIMLYYVVIYFVGSYLKDKFFLLFLLIAVGVAVWFLFLYQTQGLFSMYSPKYKIRWLLFFAFMLFGAKLGTISEEIKSKPVTDICYLVLSITLFYVMFLIGIRVKKLIFVQYFSFLPLLMAMYYFYKVGASRWAKKLYDNKFGNFFIRFVGGLCLEIYMVQSFFFTDKMNNIFPLNIVIMFIIIFIAAYLLRCLARFIAQTFKDTQYDWKKIISWY